MEIYSGATWWGKCLCHPGSRPKGQDHISVSKSFLKMSASKLRLDPGLSIEVKPDPCPRQTMVRPISPQPFLSGPLLAIPDLGTSCVGPLHFLRHQQAHLCACWYARSPPRPSARWARAYRGQCQSESGTQAKSQGPKLIFVNPRLFL